VERFFLEIISNKRRGLLAWLLRAFLRYCSFWYWLAIRIRLAAYSVLPRHRVGKPVICVGNITTGGTGKTPAVAAVVAMLKELGARPAIVSRGYRGGDSGNDEMKVLEELCPGVLHIQNANRVAGASRAIKEGASVVVLDDGFSHLRLRRDLDVLLIDALNPFGYGRMLPRGLMREPLSSLRRAGAIVISRADVATPERLLEVEDVVRCYGYIGPVLHAAHVPQKLVNLATGEEQPLEALKGKAVVPFCGIGNPRGFERTLENLGAHLTAMGTLGLEDHAALDAREITRQVQPFLRTAYEQGAQLAVCTQKDAVKLRGVDVCPGLPVYELRVEFKFLRDEAELRKKLAEVLQAAR
jgi:tetraacyldisaccharide 4'-kinase